MLSPLGFFGGPVQTMHPLIGSAAIDAAGATDPGGTDARGFSRFVDGDGNGIVLLDIGAVEAGSVISVTTAVDEDNGPGGLGRSLREALAVSAAPGSRIRFSPSQFPATITLSGTELTIPATAGLFIDASNIPGAGVTVSGENTSRVFKIPATANVAMHSLKIVNGNSGNGDGGGILNEGTCNLFFSTLRDHIGGDADSGGGGMANYGTCMVYSSTLSGNRSTAGAGIYNLGTCSVISSTFSGNRAFFVGGGGGGLWNSGVCHVLSCTFSGNSAIDLSNSSGFGGGIRNFGVCRVFSSTLSGNSAFVGGGGIMQNGGTCFLGSSIVSDNTAPIGPQIDGGGLIQSSSNLIVSNALLAPLGDYGGPTPTMPPLLGSPAIDDAGPVNEVQQISTSALPVVFTLSFNGATTIALNQFLSAADVQNALQNLGTIGAGNVTVEKTNNQVNETFFKITFVGARGVFNQPLLISSNSAAGITTVRDGSPGSLLRTDQRGFARPLDGDGDGSALPDIGAVETNGAIVTTVADTGFGSLRAALAGVAALPGPDTILFAPGLSGETIILASELVINDTDGVTLDATALTGGLTIDGGNGTNRLFFVNSGQSLTLRGLTLTGGNGTGAVASGSGGAIFNNGTLALAKCTLTANSATGEGGAILNDGTLDLTQCTLSGNSASGGGAIFNFVNAELTLTQCTLSGNAASNGGGAILNDILSTLTLSNTIIAGNTAPTGPDVYNFSGTITPTGVNLIGDAAGSTLSPGEAIRVGDAKLLPLGTYGGPTQTMPPMPGSLAIDGAGSTSAFTTDQRGQPRVVDGDNANGAQADIGAVETGVRFVTVASDNTVSPAVGSLRRALTDAATAAGWEVIVFASSLSGETITLGGEIAISDTDGVIVDATGLAGGLTLGGNNATRHFVVNSGTSLTLRGLTLSGGRGDQGGAIINIGTLTLMQCTLSGNAASGYGGTIVNLGTVTLTQCTLSGNSAGGGGGVIANSEAATVILTQCTLSGNSARVEGGAIFNNGNLRLADTVVAGNTAPDGPDLLQTGGTIIPTGVNLIGNNAGIATQFPAGPLVGTATLPLDPKLASLGHYGGPTRTMPPLRGSPAIDAAGVIVERTDQRGFRRSRDGNGDLTAQPDIGAVEASLIPVSALTDAGPGSLRAAVAEAAAQPGADTIFFTPLLIIPSVSTDILLAEEIAIDDPNGVTLDASDLPNGVAIDAGPGTNRHFRIAAGTSAVFQLLRLYGGNGTGGGGTTDGGSIHTRGNLTLRECTIADCSSPSAAGAILSDHPGVLTLERCSLYRNTAGSGGGAIAQLSLNLLTLSACTIANNSAGFEAGGINAPFGRPVLLDHCTVSGNRVTNLGNGIGGVRGDGGDQPGVTVRNSIISGNRDANTPGTPNMSSFRREEGNNFFDGDAKLSALDNYGGPTQTMPPLPGSPAIDGAGSMSAFTTDQRGLPRVVDGDNANGAQADIGAVETGVRFVTVASDDTVSPAVGSLRRALADAATAAGWEAIVFASALSGETITLVSQISISDTDGVTIDATGLAGGLTLDGNNATRHFLVGSGTSLTLRGLTLTGGRSVNGGAIFNGGTLTLTQCTLFGNSASSAGGAIFNPGASILTLTQCTLSGNSAVFGGSIVNDGMLTLTRCTLSGNSASTQGGAIRSTNILRLTNTIAAGNRAPSGPDVFHTSTDLTVTGVNFIGDREGSGLAAREDILEGDPMLTPLGFFGGPVETMHPLIGSRVIDAIQDVGGEAGQDARGFPGLVDGDEASMGAQSDIGAVEAGRLFTVTTGADEFDLFGGGSGLSLREAVRSFSGTQPGKRIRFATPLVGATLTLTLGELGIPVGESLFIDASNLSGSITVSGNDASRVFHVLQGATLAMHSLNIVSGRAGEGADGGGILNEGTCSVIGCTVSGSRAGTGGGGGIGSIGRLTLTQSTLSGNAGASGGAVFNNGSMVLTQCTLAGNSSGAFGGTIVSIDGILTLANTIVAGNDSQVGEEVSIRGGSIKTNGVNFMGVTTGSSLVASATLLTGDPLLGSLGDYGGRTQTMDLLPGSPARDAGGASGLSSDQRGFPIVGAPDIGAYEAQIGFIESVSVLEGGPPTVVNFGVGQGGTLSVISSSNAALVPVANMVLGGSGANRSVTLTPVVHQLGSSEVTLRDSLTGETQRFSITVTPDSATVVTNTNDFGSGSLRQALINAAGRSGASTITFAPGFAGPIVLGSHFIVNDSDPVAIDASGLLANVVLNANQNSRHFQVGAGNALTLRGLTLENGKTLAAGGAIISEGSLVLEFCKLVNNDAGLDGGGVFSSGPLLRAVDCEFAGNVGRDGGGIAFSGNSLELTRCTIAGGTGRRAGGAIKKSGGGSATLTQCTIAENQVSGEGATGGIEVTGGTLSLIHCTIAENVGRGAGGGLFVPGAAVVNLTNCIIALNSRASEALGLSPADVSVPDGAVLNPRGSNLIGTNEGVSALFPAGGLVGTPTAPLDPNLGGLGDYGGLTRTMPPRSGCPSIDQASSLSPAMITDQRGKRRPLGVRPDLGAVEGDVVMVTTAVDELDPDGVLGNGHSLREAVRDIPANGVINFDRAVFNGVAGNRITLVLGPLNPQRHCRLNGSLIPGGIQIGYEVTFIQQPQSADLASGQPFEIFPTVTNVSGGVSYAWRKNFVSNGVTTRGFAIPSVLEADEGVYEVVIGEALSPGVIDLGDNVQLGSFSAVSQPASLSVDGSSIAVQRNPASAMIALGTRHVLSVVAGPVSNGLTYQWVKNGKNLSKATGSSYVIPKAGLSDAGAYTCVVRSGQSVRTSGVAEIGVVDTQPRTVNLKVGGRFAASVSAAGNGLGYLWTPGGAITKGITLESVSVVNAGLYACTVSGPGGSRRFETRLNVSNAAPGLQTPLRLPAAFIGQTYFYQLRALETAGANATGFSMSGALPKGMVFNRTTGVLSGRPTVTKAGGYRLSFRAINASGSSAAVAATLTVNVVPPTAVGVFAGPLGRSVLNGNLGGRIDLTTAASGSFSGSITLGAVKRSFRNQLLLSAGQGDAILRGNISGIRLADNTLVTAYVEVFAAEQVARVTLLGAGGTTLLGTAWRNPWRVSRTAALNNPATGYAANYTVRLDAGDGNYSSSPGGYGFASFTVSSAGALTLAGRLPDGSGVTGRTFVGPEGQVLVFHLLYGNRGSQVGQWGISKAVAVVDNGVTGSTSWLKPGPLAGSKHTVYRAGFGPLTVAVEGGVYTPPGAGQLVMGLPVVAEGVLNAGILFSGGGLDPLFTYDQALRFYTRTALDKVSLVSVLAPVTNGVRITSLDSRRGTFSGSFTLPGATLAQNRTAPFSGQIVKIGAVREGFGYFLLPNVPVPPEKVTTAPKLSGKVMIGAP